jgi:hypothetical protein
MRLMILLAVPAALAWPALAQSPGTLAAEEMLAFGRVLLRVERVDNVAFHCGARSREWLRRVAAENSRLADQFARDASQGRAALREANDKFAIGVLFAAQYFAEEEHRVYGAAACARATQSAVIEALDEAAGGIR